MNSDADLDLYLNQLKKKTKKFQYDSQSDASSSSSFKAIDEISSKVKDVPKTKAFSIKTDNLSVLHQKYLNRLSTGRSYISDSDSISISSVTKTNSLSRKKIENYEKENNSLSQPSSVQTTEKDPLNNLMTVDDLLQQYHDFEGSNSIEKSYKMGETKEEISDDSNYNNYYDESFNSDQRSEISEQIEEDLQTHSSIDFKEESIIDGSRLKCDAYSTESETQLSISEVNTVTNRNSSTANTLIEKITSAACGKEDTNLKISYSSGSSSIQSKTLKNLNGNKKRRKQSQTLEISKSKNHVMLNRESDEESNKLPDAISTHHKINRGSHSSKNRAKKNCNKNKSEITIKSSSSSNISFQKFPNERYSHELNEKLIANSLTEVLPRILPDILKKLMLNNSSEKQVAFQSTSLHPELSIRIDECLRQTVVITKELLESHKQMYDTYQKTICSSHQLANLRSTEEYIHNYKRIKANGRKMH